MLTSRLRSRTLHYDDMTLAPQSRGRAAALAAAVLASAAVVVPSVSSAPTVQAAPDDIIAIVVEGTGNGHGRGMSQWGAYGYAVDHGWNWQQILGHYYGGTISGTTAANQRIDVRLTKYDGMGDVGVISHGSGVRWNGQTAPAMRANETSSGVFDIYKANTVACPSSTSLTVPDGPVVEQSAYNADAKRVQRFLRSFHPPAAGIVIDGYFGPQTRGFLAAWQASRALQIDGSRWNTDDAASARAQIAASGSSVNWTKIGTHVQSVGSPVRFTAADGEAAGTSSSDVLGVCSSGGSITHYRGAVEVVHTSSGNRVVNDVLAENYVRGVIPKEIAASWAYAGNGAGDNAVKAQAVAARSYGLAQNRSYTYDGSSTRYATTCDTTSCQVYGGAATRGSPNGSTTNVEHVATDAAILATANVVRKWPSGQIVSTEFSASNGPSTAGGAFPVVTDIGDDTAPNPYHRWTRIIDADTFAAQHGLGKITGATMAPTTSANYQAFEGIWFDDLVVTGTNGTYRRQAWDFKRAYGLRSPGFTVRVIRESTTGTSMAFIGDSVGNGVTNSAGEFRQVTDGTYASQILDATDSRCTTRESCPGSTGVTVANSLPTGLDLAVVELGYNDNPATFPSDIDAMMSALSARGVQRVVWVNMADIRRTVGGGSFYAAANAALAAAPSRWSNLTVLDWDAASDTPERSRWFSSDGVHLTATGEAEFSLWLREQILDLTPTHYLSPPKRIELPVVGALVPSSSGALVSIPSEATGVSLNVTMVRPNSRGFASVWPCEDERPVVSSLNAQAGEVIANNVIAPISDEGTVCFYSSVGTNLVVDVAGWFGDSDGADAVEPFVRLRPERRVDTRSGLGGRSSKVAPSSPLSIPVVGVAARLPGGTPVTVPPDAVAVAVNVTITQASSKGFATVWPCGTPRPLASNVNFASTTPTGNGVIAPIGDDGSICVHTSTSAEVIVDLAGYFGGSDVSTPGAETPFTASSPTRLVDTRVGVGAAPAPVQAATPLRIQVGGAELDNPDDPASPMVIPSDASAVAMNLTVVRPSADGFATVWPCGSDRPLASNLNYVAGRNRANAVIAPIGADGTVCVYVNRSSHVVVDVAGWFRGGDDPSFFGAAPVRLVDTRFAVGPIPS